MGDNSTPESKASNGTSDEHVIYVTGFGPFGPHTINASEAAVRLVSRSSLASELGVKVVTEILDVDYAKIQNLVPQQWDQYKPQLVVHVGVSGQADRLTLEQCAHNTGYHTLDILYSCPPQHCCVPGGNTELKTALPLESVCEALNKRPNLRLKTCLSQDPGRYLCSFVYYTSLLRDRRRAVFVHVPPLDVCPAEDIALSLKEAIALLYRAVTDKSAAPASASSTLANSEEVSGKTLGCAEKSSMVGCDGEKSVKGHGSNASCLNGSGKGGNEKCGETISVQGSLEAEKSKGCKSVDGLENGSESVSHLSSAMMKMSTANDQTGKPS